MQKFDHLQGVAAPMPQANVDTDQIIPKQFLKTVEREGLGKGLFYDFRFDFDGREKPDFVLNQSAYKGVKMLIAGDNFGCGSSREHAPWALYDFGFRAVIAPSIADIFRSNALETGIVTLVVDGAVFDRLSAAPGAEATVDLETRQLRFAGESVGFTLDPFARRRLLDGADTLGWLLRRLPDIQAFEERRAA